MLKERNGNKPIESEEQLELEKTIKYQAQEFLKEFNSNLPKAMELEYEGFYRRGLPWNESSTWRYFKICNY